MKRLFLALAAGLFAASISFAATPPASATLSEKIGEIIRTTEKVPNTGVAVAVVKNGELILTEGYGFADRASRRPVTADSTFAIASITKSFTATALAMLQERRVVDFDRPVRAYLPGFRMKDPVASARATLADFMSHRSGMPRHEYLWMVTDFSMGEIVRKFADLEPSAVPELGFRQGFQYSNLNFDLAGVVLEKRLGKSWGAFMMDEVFRPLGMTRSSVSVSALERSPDRARPYAGAEALKFLDVAGIRAAGGINSSAKDMAQFLLMNLRGGKSSRGESLLGASALKDLWKPRAIIPTKSGDLAYGLGWFVEGNPQAPIIWHGGNLIGYTSLITFNPADGSGMVILINQDHDDLVYTLSEEIYKLLAERTSFNSLARSAAVHAREINSNRVLSSRIPVLPKRKRKTSVRFAGASPEALIGTYYHPAYGYAKIGRSAAGDLGIRYYFVESPILAASDSASIYQFGVDLAGVRWDEQFEAVSTEGGKVTRLKFPFEPSAGETVFRRTVTR